MMATENENLKNNNQQLTIQLNAYKDKEDVKAQRIKKCSKYLLKVLRKDKKLTSTKT